MSERKARAARTGGAELRADGWLNVVTALGTVNDKRMHGRPAPRVMQQTETEEMWQASDTAAKAVETIPDEMFREGYDLHVTIPDADTAATKLGDKGARSREIVEDATAMAQTLKLDECMSKAYKYMRAHGGGVVFIGADDGATDLREPLRLEAVKAIRFLSVFTPRECFAVTYSTNMLKPGFGDPEIFRICPDVLGTTDGGARWIEVHASRLIHFCGFTSSRKHQRERRGHGDSVFCRIDQQISDFEQSFAAGAHLLQDFAQAVVYLNGLAEMLENDEDDLVKKRIQYMDLMRSIARMLMLDKDDKVERQTTSLAGLSDMLDRMALRCAAALEIPVTLFMGQAPAGLNATGAADLAGFYAKCKRLQIKDLEPGYNKFYEILFASKEGPTKGQEPETWSVSWRPLQQMTQAQIVDMRNKQALTDQIYYGIGVASASDLAGSRFGRDGYSIETTVDFDAIQAMQEAQPEPGEEPPTDPNAPKPKPGEPANVPGNNPREPSTSPVQ